jgi:D-aminopeptidase
MIHQAPYYCNNTTGMTHIRIRAVQSLNRTVRRVSTCKIQVVKTLNWAKILPAINRVTFLPTVTVKYVTSQCYDNVSAFKNVAVLCCGILSVPVST